jgi:ParB family chromosome partitioning protein
MSKRSEAIAEMELDGPPRALVPARRGRRPGRLSLDTMRPNPEQPRQHFEATAVLQLAADIAERGLMQPIVVGPPDGDGIHTIIAGERRWRACSKADLAVAEVVIDYDRGEPQAMFDAALAENIQREDLTRQDLAAALRKVKTELAVTDEQLAQRYNKSIDWVRQVLAFADLPDASQRFMEEHKVPTALARAIRPLPGDTQLDVLRAVHPLEGRDLQLERIGEVKDLLRQGVPVEGALDVVGHSESPARAPRSHEPRPTKLTRPFVWQPAGDITFLRVNYGALAQVRLTRTRSGPYESWLEALVEDITAVRDTCADNDDAGGEAWSKLREAVKAVVEGAAQPE